MKACRIDLDLLTQDNKERDYALKRSDAEMIADESIFNGTFEYEDLIDAMTNAQRDSKIYVRAHVGSDNCAVGGEVHMILREYLIQKALGEM